MHVGNNSNNNTLVESTKSANKSPKSKSKSVKSSKSKSGKSWGQLVLETIMLVGTS